MASLKKLWSVLSTLIVIAVVALAILLAPLYMSYSDMIHQDVFNKLRSPCAEHPLGTDELGRDLLARILYGGSVKPGNAAAFASCPDVDGVLVGGDSLNAEAFVDIVGRVLDA